MMDALPYEEAYDLIKELEAPIPRRRYYSKDRLGRTAAFCRRLKGNTFAVILAECSAFANSGGAFAETLETKIEDSSIPPATEAPAESPTELPSPVSDAPVGEDIGAGLIASSGNTNGAEQVDEGESMMPAVPANIRAVWHHLGASSCGAGLMGENRPTGRYIPN